MSKLSHSHPSGILIECPRCEQLVHEDDCVQPIGGDEPVCPTCSAEVMAENGPFGVGA